MPDHKSEIDDFVLAMRSNREHEFEDLKIDDETVAVCKRCGRTKPAITADDVVRPCRGFV